MDRAARRRRSSRGARPWGVASFVALLGSGAVLWLLVLRADRIVQFGIARPVYYALLVALALVASGFLFGALKSYARYSGTQYGGTLELGGPAVLFLIVLVVGLTLAAPTETFEIAVRFRGEGVPPGALSGRVALDLGTDRRVADVTSAGEAKFSGVPAAYRGRSVIATPQIDGYVVDGSGEYRVPADGVLYVALRRAPPPVLAGTVVNRRGDPVSNAIVSVRGGTADARTDERGRFTLEVPAVHARVRVEVWVDGILRYDNFVTTPGPVTVTLDR